MENSEMRREKLEAQIHQCNQELNHLNIQESLGTGEPVNATKAISGIGQTMTPVHRDYFLNQIQQFEQDLLRRLAVLGKMKDLVKGSPDWQLAIAHQFQELTEQLR